MLIHLDTSVLVDAFTGPRRSLPRLRAATANGDETAFSTLVLYEWLRGPRTGAEREAVDAFFGIETVSLFGVPEAARAADLYRRGKRARQRQADLAIAACAIEHGARLWTLHPADFSDIANLQLYVQEST
jgi:predicted nucleic acid-binding protein